MLWIGTSSRFSPRAEMLAAWRWTLPSARVRYELVCIDFAACFYFREHHIKLYILSTLVAADLRAQQNIFCHPQMEGNHKPPAGVEFTADGL